MASKPSHLSDRDDELGELVFTYLVLRDAGATHAAALGRVLARAPERAADLVGSLQVLSAAGLLPNDEADEEFLPQT